MAHTQENLYFTISSPLGKDKLLFKSLSGEEKLSGLFHLHLEMLSEFNSLSFDGIVGKNLGVTVQFAEDHRRYFNGVVTRFVQAGGDPRFTVYYAELRPWLWMLGLSRNCKIFQHLSVPEIIKKIFQAAGYTDFKDALSGTYAPREYCVQYEESDLDFVSRLMEDEGIFYFFEHEESKHTLVLADDADAHADCPGIPKARYLTAENQTRPEDAIVSCSWAQQVSTGKYAVDDFNFETPLTDLKVEVAGQTGNQRVYEYAPNFMKTGDGQKIAKRRIEGLEWSNRVLQGQGHCFSFIAGYKFEMAEHPNPSWNKKYVLYHVAHSLTFERYSNSFEAFPADAIYRPPLHTRKPRIHGTQTAIVTGKQGEEIWTDKYGRIKVQFHWDQDGRHDENTTCWIRVNQGLAGKTWGSFWLPRIGQEVIVGFINGDPDRPIVTGSVYNAVQKVPYPLPEEQTKSTLKSNLSKGGRGFNELRFEDKKGQEQIFIHAERNQDIRVEKDVFEWIGENRHLIVNANQYEAVKKDKSQSVEGDKFEEISYDNNRKVGGNQTISIGKNYNLSIAGDSVVKVGRTQHTTVGGPVNLRSGEKISVRSKQFQQKVKKDYALTAECIDVSSESIFKLSAKDAFTIEAGGSFITLNKDGIYFNGKKLYLNSGGSQVESCQCDPQKPKPTCPPDPCTNPCEADDASSGWKSALKNILDSLDIKVGIKPDGRYYLDVTGEYGPVNAKAGVSGNLRTGDFTYYGDGSLDTPYVDAEGGFKGDDEGKLTYYGDGTIITPYGKVTGHVKGDERGNVHYRGTASGKVGPVDLDGGIRGDSHGNFSWWVNAGVRVADLLDQAAKQGTPLVQICEGMDD